MKKNILTIILLATILIISSADVMAQAPECCSRHAIIKSCTINDPMGMMGPAGSGVTPADLKDFGDSGMTVLGPEGSFCRSIQTTLTQLLTRDCFHLQDRQSMDRSSPFPKQDEWTSTQKAANPGDTEYSFDVEMVSGLDEYTDEERPIRSKATVELYFDGEQRELVHRWTAYGTWDTVSNTGTTSLGLFNKLDQSINAGPDIMEILERFEKRPVDCRVSPEKEEQDVGEVIDIELSDFTDMFGERSREFNRIVVHAYSGSIINGEPCDIGPDYRVFKVDDGTVKVKYRAPDDCSEKEDRLTVYSSCEILPEDRSPISETKIKERVIEKTLKIKCSDATLVLRKKVEITLRTSQSDDSNDGPCQSHLENQHTINESVEASITVSLKLEESQDMPVFNQRWEYYRPVSVSLSGFSFTSSENKHSASNYYGSGCAKAGHETNIDYNRSATKYEIANKQYAVQTSWMVVFDNESGKAVKIIPSGYSINYEVNEQEEMRSVVFSKDGPDEDSSSENRTLEQTLELGPVGEEVPDPTIKKSDTWLKDYLARQGVELPQGINIPTPSNEETVSEIPPDILVKTGDGKTSFGGNGNRTIRKELEDGYSEENLSFSWTMRRRQK